MRRRRHRPKANDYVCPYGIIGCAQDCPGCRPDPLPLTEESESDLFPAIDEEIEF